MFIPTHLTRTYNTRFKHLATIPKSKTATGSKCLRYKLPEALLIIPHCIKEKIETHSPQGYSNYIKHYFIDKYSETCIITNCYICNKVSS